MNHVKIKIQSVKEAEAGKRIIENATPETVTESQDVTVAFLESGTASGRTSVMVCLGLPDGKTAIAQITPDNFEGIYAAFKGAQQRFGK